MSATLVQGNTNLNLLSGSQGSGINVITPVMAVSVCRPSVSSGVPSRHGSAVSRSQLPSKSLPSHAEFRMQSKEGNPVASTFSSSLLESYPPVEDAMWASSSRDSVTLPKIRSPVQLSGTSDSQASLITSIDAISLKERSADAEAHLDQPNPPSIFPNFRALQRMAASAKLRLNNLKSKEAKAITTLLNQEKTSQSNESHSCHEEAIEKNNFLNSSWESHADDDHSHVTDLHTDKVTSKSSRTKKFHRSRSRRRGGKTPARKKNSPAPNKDDISSLADFTLASTMTLNTRWQKKKVETFSTKYNKKHTANKTKEKDKASRVSSQISLTTVALEKRNTSSTSHAATKQSTAETSRTVFEHAATVYGSGNQVSVRLSNKFRSSESEHAVKKVFLSEKQSSMLKDCGKGVPCAPPTSPTPQQLEKFEYVPSLTDLRSQRALKDRLIVMDVAEKKKNSKMREEKAKQEKQTARNNINIMRQKQRQQIYALNKVMTEYENSQFQKFCEKIKKEKEKT